MSSRTGGKPSRRTPDMSWKTGGEPSRRTPNTPSRTGDKPSRRATDVVGARIGAQIVDLVLMFVQVLVVASALGFLVRPEGPGSARAFAYLSMITLPLYGGLLEGYWNGQTVGKWLAGIKVVDRRGNDPSIGQALLRNLPAIILFSWLTTAVALAAIATSSDNQRLFDNVAGTYVVRA